MMEYSDRHLQKHGHKSTNSPHLSVNVMENKQTRNRRPEHRCLDTKHKKKESNAELVQLKPPDF